MNEKVNANIIIKNHIHYLSYFYVGVNLYIRPIMGVKHRICLPNLEIDHEWMADHNNVTIAFWINIDDFADSRIVMTPRYFHEFRHNPFLKFDLWHEIVHFHTLHYFDTAFDENGSSNKTRMEYFERGDVMPDEKAADLFSLYYTSKEDAIQALCESIRRRRTYTWELPETTNLTIEEFRRRKRLLRDLVTDEKVRDALCRLCGKDNYLEI